MDRRVLWAIALMIVIAVVPSVFLKKPTRPVPAQPAQAPDSSSHPTDSIPRLAVDSSAAGSDTSQGTTVQVTSPLYQYGISTLGGRLVEITLPQYKSFAKAETGKPVQVVPPESDFLGLKLLVGSDTLRLSRWVFTPSAEALTASATTPLTLTASRGDVKVTLTYRFDPASYLFSMAWSGNNSKLIER